MRIPFSLYDILTYILPGGFTIIVILILINPGILEHPLNDATNGFAYYLPTTLIQSILYGFACYFVGFVWRACRDVLSKYVPVEELYVEHGKFMKELLNLDCKDASPYSKQFVCEFRNQIEEIFRVKVDKMERDGEYREIFSFCRMAIMKQSPAIYSRVNLWFRRYDSAKAMVYVVFMATLGFLVRGVYPQINWLLIILTVISFLAGWLFLHLYKRHLGNYRKTVLYGFYEYAVTREKSGDAD